MKIISEIHPQHGGNIAVASEMIRQSALNGADMVKFQWYTDGLKLLGKDYSDLELSLDDCKHLMRIAEFNNIELFFSIFDENAFNLNKDLGIKKIKIASRTVQDTELCKKIIDYADEVYISLGMWDEKNLPFGIDDKIKYFFCIAQYPTYHYEVGKIPKEFNKSSFEGFSDHTLGIDMCMLAASRGAFLIEKHFSLDKTNQKDRQLAHACSMNAEELNELSNFGKRLFKSNKFF